MAEKETIKDIIQGLIDVDKGVIDKINQTVDDLSLQIARGSGSYALLDINTPDIGGSGVLVDDASASHGKAVRVITSGSANLVPITGAFSDIKFGHYAICARVKTDNLTSSELIQLKLLNGSTEILAANFKGTHFSSTSQYSYLYSTFVYEAMDGVKQPLSFQLHTHLISGVQIDFDYVYVSMIIPAVFL